MVFGIFIVHLLCLKHFSLKIILHFYCFTAFSAQNELIFKKNTYKGRIKASFVENIIENYPNIFKEVFS